MWIWRAQAAREMRAPELRATQLPPWGFKFPSMLHYSRPNSIGWLCSLCRAVIRLLLLSRSRRPLRRPGCVCLCLVGSCSPAACIHC